MIFKKAVSVLFFSFFVISSLYAQQQYSSPQSQAAQESDQQISEFSLAGYGEKGKKTWDIAGKSADIFTDVIKLKDITGNLYGEKENIELTADKGDFDKQDGKIHLEQNVVITSSSGAKLTTESLDWDRKNEIVNTKDKVNIEKENMVTIATGATGRPNLKKVTLEKDVTVNINPPANKEQVQGSSQDKTVITCDKSLEIDYEKNIATFNNNVKVDREDVRIYSDAMDVYFGKTNQGNSSNASSGASSDATPMLMGSKIEKIVARGNVKIVRGENISYSDEATYNTQEKKIILTGRPKLIIYSEGGGLGASFGN